MTITARLHARFLGVVAVAAAGVVAFSLGGVTREWAIGAMLFTLAGLALASVAQPQPQLRRIPVRIDERGRGRR